MVICLIVLEVLITWALAAAVAAPLLGMSRGAALMLGVILVVSGPTVVGPLLDFVRPTERLQRILIWEGSLIDPIGGILGALVFHAVSASTSKGPGSQLAQFLLSLVIGLAGGVIGIGLLWRCCASSGWCEVTLYGPTAAPRRLAVAVAAPAATRPLLATPGVGHRPRAGPALRRPGGADVGSPGWPARADQPGRLELAPGELLSGRADGHRGPPLGRYPGAKVGEHRALGPVRWRTGHDDQLSGTGPAATADAELASQRRRPGIIRAG